MQTCIGIVMFMIHSQIEGSSRNPPDMLTILTCILPCSHPSMPLHKLHGRCIEVGAGITALPGLVAARLGVFDEVSLFFPFWSRLTAPVDIACLTRALSGLTSEQMGLVHAMLQVPVQVQCQL